MVRGTFFTALRVRHGLAAVAAVTVAVAIGGCDAGTPAKSEIPPAPVRVVAVQYQTASDVRRYTGTIRPRYESDLAFRVGGKIVERLVNVGDRVEGGQIIARLDATDLRLSRDAQIAELAAAKSSRDEAIAAEERYRILLSKGHVAQAAMDQRRAAADEVRGRVERAERTLETLTNQVAYAQLRADNAGVVSALPVEVGQVVTAGQRIAHVARLDALEAVIPIAERDIPAVGDAALISLWPQQSKTFVGKVREISPDADAVSRTYAVRIAITDPDDAVRLGKTATVNLTREQKSAQTASLPLSAVMNDANGPMVWVVDTGGTQIERRAVTVARFAQDRVEITGGLEAGERVVALGVHVLDAAMPVRIVETQTMARATAAPTQ